MTSRWRTELQYFWRYTCAGAFNAIIGLGSIFVLMQIGFPPMVANIAGYGLSLVLAFITARRFVFRSGAKVAPEGVRYLAAFAFSFLCNLGALHVLLNVFAIHPVAAQLVSIAVYVAVMYSTSRLLVFSATNR